MSTCRICKGDRSTKWNSAGVDVGPLLQYGVRHYAHAGCGLDKWGDNFFDRLHPWQVQQFPYFLAKHRGFGEILAARVDLLKVAV